MKKILAIFLALVTIMSVALVACDKNNGGTTGGNSNDDDDDDIFVTQGNNKDTSDTDDSKDSTNSDVDAWSTVSCNIYSMVDQLNVLDAVNGKTTVKSYKLFETLTAVEKNSSWYKVTYDNGKVGYVRACYVTESANSANFTDLATPEKITIAEKYKEKEVTLRTNPALVTNEDVKDGASSTYFDTYEGESGKTLYKVGANADNTWWKVSFNADGTNPVYVKLGTDARLLFGLGGSNGGFS